MPSYVPQTSAPSNNVTFHNWPGPGEAGAEHYHISHAVVIPPGVSTIHVGGQVGITADGTVPEDLEEEIIEAFRHIEASLREAGLSGDRNDVWGCVYKINTFHANRDATFAPTFIKVVRNFFGTNRPLFTGIDVHQLFMPALHLEIEVEAFIPVEK